jgi:MIP family channel proteins
VEENLYGLSQKLLAEFIGTFGVVLAAAGSLCAEQYLRAVGQGGPGTPAPGVLSYALAYGLAVGVMVSAVGPVSGGQLNPAVTAGMWVTRRLNTLHAILYCAAQMLGAAVASYFLAMVIPESTWRPVALGTPDLAPDFTRMHGMLLEAVMTLVLVFVYFAMAAQLKGSHGKLSGFVVGLAITADVLLGQPFTGASMNPARTFGPALVAHHWINHGVYWVGPLFGGVLAGVLYERFFEVDPSA